MGWQDAMIGVASVLVLLALLWYLAGRFWQKMQDILAAYEHNRNGAVGLHDHNYIRDIRVIQNEMAQLKTKLLNLEKNYQTIQTLINGYFSKQEQTRTAAPERTDRLPVGREGSRQDRLAETGETRVSGVQSSSGAAPLASSASSDKAWIQADAGSASVETEAPFTKPAVSERTPVSREAEEKTARSEALEQLRHLLSRKGEEGNQLFNKILSIDKNAPSQEKLQVINQLFLFLDSEEQKYKKLQLKQWCATLFNLNIDYPVPGDPISKHNYDYIKKDYVTNNSILRKVNDFNQKIIATTDRVILFVEYPSVSDKYGILLQKGKVIIS